MWVNFHKHTHTVGIAPWGYLAITLKTQVKIAIWKNTISSFGDVDRIEGTIQRRNEFTSLEFASTIIEIKIFTFTIIDD
jgi:hypothetical protein